ncbi:unnamed protein product [Rotaria sp. Silwood1]|nr:unnamed protein product [Rotaria sp. Silwood1]
MPESTSTISPSVVCNLERAQWEKNASFSLDSIAFDAHPGDLICVVGPVGAGKSSLLQTLTGEIAFFDGHVRLHGSFCYVPQESWIFSSTIKNNILFGKDYDSQLFQRVVQATALDSDFAQLPHGENTLVGDQGAMLSGCLFQVFGVVALVVWLHPWSIVPALISAGGLLFVRYRFASTSRDLKRLEGITRSPVYSHLTSTIHGLKVVRSYRAEDVWSTKFLAHLDNNTRANHLIIATNRWAAVRFDWVALMFVGLVTLLAMILRVTEYHNFSPAEIALVLSYSLSLMVLLQWTIRQSVVIETQMTSVERVLDYCSLDQEPPAQVPHDCRPPASWPSHGEIVFDNVSMRHSTEIYLPLDLRHISMTIRASEKVGIVGRTGAGKSSLIQTLFRMGTLVDGKIKIDNIDITSVGLDDVRRCISIIPQDPVLFTGTMRSNLDPFGDYSDEEIWHALEQVFC